LSYKEKSNVLEIEVKVKVENLQLIRDQLLALGAHVERERTLEDDTFYDFRPLALLRKKHALRLRTVQKKAFLTFKGTPQKSRKFKIREEHETEVKNVKQTKRILKALGFGPVFRLAKHRTVLKKGRLKICLDETPIGLFIEFEGERENIARLAKRLQIPKARWVKKDYVHLIKNSGEKALKE
jgi:adenylate cyclase class 2